MALKAVSCSCNVVKRDKQGAMPRFAVACAMQERSKRKTSCRYGKPREKDHGVASPYVEKNVAARAQGSHRVKETTRTTEKGKRGKDGRKEDMVMIL